MHEGNKVAGCCCVRAQEDSARASWLNAPGDFALSCNLKRHSDEINRILVLTPEEFHGRIDLENEIDRSRPGNVEMEPPWCLFSVVEQPSISLVQSSKAFDMCIINRRVISALYTVDNLLQAVEGIQEERLRSA
jgi:hypothetical protein